MFSPKIIKFLTHVLPLVVLILTPFSVSFYRWYQEYSVSLIHTDWDKIHLCRKEHRPIVEYLSHVSSQNLTSNSYDDRDQVFCLGSYFGDLNSTYVTIKNCYLEMYHQEKLIWSSKQNTFISSEYACVLSLQRDGNLVLYREGTYLIYAFQGESRGKLFASAQWDSQTSFNPVKTELKIKDQQLQIVQTFKDGTKRLFYAGEGHEGFREDIGEPKKIADRFVLKKAEDKDKIILRRNEYTGDLNETYLILETNCYLQLFKKNKRLWSITPHLKHQMNCVLNIDENNEVVISRIVNDKSSETQKIMHSDDDFEIVENRITFEDEQPMILQTLKNGSKITFTSGIGQNNGLKLKREPRQLAENTLAIIQDHNRSFQIERMDYIGNLTGLHLILQQNCSLMLVNGNEKLWELQSSLHNDPLMDCFIRFESNGTMRFERQYSSFEGGSYNILAANNDDKDFITGYQLTLENNQLRVTRQFKNRAPDTYLTRPSPISARSLIINGDDQESLVLPEMSFIENVTRVYSTFRESCNSILYNETEMIWDSETPKKESSSSECALILMRNDSFMITSPWSYRRESLATDPKGDILRTEILANNDGFWMLNTYAHHSRKLFQALEDMNGFIQVPPNEHRE